MKKLFYILLFSLMAGVALGQTILDSYTDGNFTANPTWSGDASNWTIVTSSDVAAGASNSNTLRLSAPKVIQYDYLSTQIANWGSSQEWGFFLGRRAQAYTAANKVFIWLYANDANLESSTVDGYQIVIGDDSGNDEILVQSVTNGVGTTFLTSANSIPNGLTDIGILIRVTRSSSGLWELFTSTLPTVNGTGAIASMIPNASNASISQGTATNTTYTPSANGFFGIVAYHSTGDNAIATVELDQVYFTIPGTPSINLTPSSMDYDTLLLNDTLESSYVVSGDNLTAGITVTAPSSEFKVSLTSGSGYSNSVTIPLQGDSVPPTNVYAIMVPTSEGTKSGNITNASAGAATQNVAVSGYGTKIHLLSNLASFGGVEVGQTSAEQYYRLAASGLGPESNLSVTAPLQYLVSLTSGSGYSSSCNIRADENGRILEDTVFVRFSPSSTGTKFDSISHVSSGAITRYQRVYGRGVDSEPTVQASNINFSNINTYDMRVSWNRGNGAGCVVVARCENPVANVPWDGYFYPYTAGVTDSFGKGSSLGDGHYVVYKGTGTQVTVRKLYGISTYHFAVFEYNGPDSCENYLTSAYPTGYQITNSMSGKISLTSLGIPYSQDFNSLDTSAQNLPTGWNYREEGSQANYLYTGGIGASNTGNVYSYGTVPEQAFGTLASGNLIPCLSAVFTNNTDGILTAVDIGYWGELWRLGNPARYDTLHFSISTAAGNWTANSQLDLLTPDTTGSYGPRDGNQNRYRAYKWASISGLNIANGADFRIRWLDHDIFSYDDGLAIDDFQLIPFNGVSIPRIIGTSPPDSAKDVAINAPIKIGFSEPMNPSSLIYTCSPDPGGWSASWNATYDTVTLSHNNFQYHQVGYGYTFTVTQARDTEGFNLTSGPKPNPFFFTTVYNPNAPPMYVTMLNVGQGDCIVIRSPTGKRILVDAGDGGDDIMITNFIKDSIDLGTNTKYLDYTFLSHYHDDHGGGLDEVISRLDSLRAYACDRGDWHTSGNSTYSNYIDSLTSKGWLAKRHPVSMGETFDIGGGAYLQVITFNGKTLSGDSIVPAADDENNHSLGLLLNYADKFKMIMCGDISKNVERLLSPDLGGRISILKSNHHGSDDANGLKWVTDLNPMVTLIPVGDGNSYGHVHIGARDSLLADPKTSKAAGDSNRIYRTELGSGAGCVAGRDTAMYENIHIEVTPANISYCFKVLNDGTTYPWLGGSPLSAHLTSFTALIGEEGVQLAWRTESEENTYLWEIERSAVVNGNYTKIGIIPGHGTTSQPHDYQFVDAEELSAGTYWYRLCEVELDGKRNYYGPVSVDYCPGGRFEFALGKARPNPFNRITTIDYQIKKAGTASLKVYNVLGQEVRTLADGEHAAGRHQAAWDGRDGKGRRAANGIYFYRLEAGGDRASERLMLLR